MKPYFVAVLLLILLASDRITSGQERSVYKLPHISTGRLTEGGVDYKMPGPVEGYVPDKETALKISEIILFRRSSAGKTAVIRQRPYYVVQDGDVWWVTGASQKTVDEAAFKIAISKQTGAVLYTRNGANYKTPELTEGYVPDKETAINIAEVILFRLSSAGERATVAQRPYTVVQDDDIWWIMGTFRAEEFGSAIQIAISKQTGAVLYLQL